MMSGSLLANLRQQSRRISSIIRRRHFNCGAYSTSAGGLVSRNSGIVSNKRIPGSIGSKGKPPFLSSSHTQKYYKLVEVFSVFVNGVNHKLSTVCGSIKMHRRDNVFSYDRDYDNPEVLSEDKSILSLECHAPIHQSEFSLQIYVVDPIHDLEICQGKIKWRNCKLNPCDRNLTYFNKRLCSLVQGKHGYAVVHYAMLGYSDLAVVEVTLSPCNAIMIDPLDVSGSVYARYGDHDYSTDYQKKYFRSRLFDRPCQKPVRVAAYSSLPLFKSVIAVPSDSLIIDVDLCVRGISSLTGEAFVSSEEFEIDIDSPGEYMEITGVNYRVGLSVISY